MKKIILLLTLALLILSSNISYAQDVRLLGSLLELNIMLENNDEEIMATRKDFLAMRKVTDSQRQKKLLDKLTNILEQYHLVLEYQNYVLMPQPYVSKNKRNNYYKILNLSLLASKGYIDWFYQYFEGLYPYLEITSALHSVDKVKKNMLATLAKIDSTSGLLPKP